jgi:hypothetical protein
MEYTHAVGLALFDVMADTPAFAQVLARAAELGIGPRELAKRTARHVAECATTDRVSAFAEALDAGDFDEQLASMMEREQC